MASGCIPNPTKAVVATGHNERAIAVEIDGSDRIRMSGQDLQTLARFDVPDSNGLIERAGDDHVGLGIKVDAENVIGMSMKGLDEGSSGHVPEPEGLVVGGRDQQPRVLREGKVGDSLLVALKFMERREEGAGIGPIEGVGAQGLVCGGGSEQPAVR